MVQDGEDGHDEAEMGHQARAGEEAGSGKAEEGRSPLPVRKRGQGSGQTSEASSQTQSYRLLRRPQLKR